MVKAVQCKSAFPLDILSELVESAKVKMLEASDRLSSITAEMESDGKRVTSSSPVCSMIHESSVNTVITYLTKCTNIVNITVMVTIII